MNNLSYTFFRNELDNHITMFISGYDDWLGKELDYQLFENKFLINIDSIIYITDILPNILFQNLLHNFTSMILVNQKTEFIANTLISPFINENLSIDLKQGLI